MNEDMLRRQRAVAEARGVPQLKRHIFLCADQSIPKCSSKQQSMEAWEYLVRRLDELGLAGPEGYVYRTRANCFRMCSGGPIAVVYPRGLGTASVIRPFWNGSFRSISSAGGWSRNA